MNEKSVKITIDLVNTLSFRAFFLPNIKNITKNKKNPPNKGWGSDYFVRLFTLSLSRFLNTFIK